MPCCTPDFLWYSPLPGRIRGLCRWASEGLILTRGDFHAVAFLLHLRRISFFALLLVFAVPAWGQEKGVGVVTALTGKADLKRPQAPEASLKLRDNLFVRDVVDTHEQSIARILLMGKASVTVRELSRFEIREETHPDGTQRALINLAAGKIRVMVAHRLMKPGDEVRIQTPNAVAAVRGTDGIFEVTNLADGSPRTVVTGISGEFKITLPTTPPFVARGKKFLDGPARASGGPRVPFVAVAEVASDLGPGFRVAQGLPGSLSVTNRQEVDVSGFAGAQQVRDRLLSQGELNQRTANFQINVGSTGGGQTPSSTNDKIVAQGFAAATTATLVSGEQPGLGTGGSVQNYVGGAGGDHVITACSPNCPVPSSPPSSPPPPSGQLFVAPPPTGNDANSGLQTDPFATIAKGVSTAETLNTATPGSVNTIILQPGTFTETIAAISNITIQGAGVGQTFVIPSSPAVLGDNVVNFTLTGLTALGTHSSPAISFTGSSDFTLKNSLLLSRLAQGVSLSGTTSPGDISISKTEIWAGKEGILLSGNSSGAVTITNSEIWAADSHGIVLRGSFTGPVTIQNNEIWAENEPAILCIGTLACQSIVSINNTPTFSDEPIQRRGQHTGDFAVVGKNIKTEGVGIDLRGEEIGNLTFANNRIRSLEDGISLRGEAGEGRAVGDITFTNNRIWSESDDGIALRGEVEGSVAFTNNRIRAGKDGISFRGEVTDALTIGHTRIWAADKGIELKGDFEGPVSISANTVLAGGGGISLEGGFKGPVSLTGNTIDAGSDGIDFCCTFNGSVTVANNKITAGRNGLVWNMTTSSPTITDAPVISDNIVKSALASFPTNPAMATVGIITAANSIVRNNTISGFNVGILTGGSALIQGNLITGNQIGILIASCCPTLVGNIIQNNAIAGVKILPNVGMISALGNTFNPNVQGANAAGKFTTVKTIVGPAISGKNFVIAAGSSIKVGP